MIETAPRVAGRRRRHGLGPSLWGVAGTVVAASLGGVIASQAVATWPGPDPTAPGASVLSAMLLLGAALLGWLTLVLAAATWQVRPGRTLPSHSPAPVRLVGALLISLSAATTGAAQAAPVASQQQAADLPGTPAVDQERRAGESPVRTEPPAPAPPVPGWTPTAPRAEPARGEATLVTGPVAETLPDHVVVRRGDTLWDLAARHLGPEATVAEVAQEWPRWYAANRGVIGADPDLLLPGQELVVPAADEVDR
ncbi:LysM peptidoglycan-binding domain-containing protein [Serinicoccus kebangsaanensis]|uniref:LysM peptidoglycan-binding domain-containing protein n=1 Tax=Serinicoccus kebangsaanensis TaxID=2602069 RepID=UPI00192DA02B|nr:LysM domain-containing protein [Serinicoccus kebangsaanensis]